MYACTDAKETHVFIFYGTFLTDRCMHRILIMEKRQTSSKDGLVLCSVYAAAHIDFEEVVDFGKQLSHYLSCRHLWCGANRCAHLQGVKSGWKITDPSDFYDFLEIIYEVLLEKI